MEIFLNESAVQRSRTRVRLVTRIFTGLAVLALIVFVSLCLLTRTGNARLTLRLAVFSMILFGWGLIALWLFALEPARAEERHLTGLTEAETVVRVGRLYPDSVSFRIPKSVRVIKVHLETAEKETFSLNLNEKLADRLPPEGSLVRVQTARKFITGLEVLEPAPEQPAGQKPVRQKTFFGSLGRFLLPAVLWAMMALILTGFVFNQITDTTPENRIVLYADCEIQNAPELAEKLETALNGAVRMVKIHPFSYALFDSARLKQADLFIVPDSRKEAYQEWFAEEEGIPVFDPSGGFAVAQEYFLYHPAGHESETYRLYLGGSSVHLADGLAGRTAELLLSMTDTAKEDTP